MHHGVARPSRERKLKVIWTRELQGHVQPSPLVLP